MARKGSNSLILVPPEEAPWMPDWAEFALTYNAYERHGGLERVSELARKVREEFDRFGRLPEDLDTLRCALFWEQRAIRWNEPGNLLKNNQYRRYLDALKRKIREVSGGSVPGPPDPAP